MLLLALDAETNGSQYEKLNEPLLILLIIDKNYLKIDYR